jgi:hypothetical protein
MGCASSAMRPVESAIITTLASSANVTLTFFTRPSAENVFSLRPVRSGSFVSGRTSSQRTSTG